MPPRRHPHMLPPPPGPSSHSPTSGSWPKRSLLSAHTPAPCFLDAPQMVRPSTDDSEPVTCCPWVTAAHPRRARGLPGLTQPVLFLPLVSPSCPHPQRCKCRPSSLSRGPLSPTQVWLGLPGRPLMPPMGLGPGIETLPQGTAGCGACPLLALSPLATPAHRLRVPQPTGDTEGICQLPFLFPPRLLTPPC